MKKFALLFAGCIEDQYNQSRYKNDLGYMNKVLQQNHFQNIDILYFDGSSINYNHQVLSTTPGTKSNFFDKIHSYENLLKDDDLLFIMVSNHGNLCGGLAGINCWGTDTILQNEFSLAVSKVKGKKVIVMGQCYGGNFINETIPNSIIISANSKDKVSFASLNVDYDEFLYHFISFYNNGYPNGSPLNTQAQSKSIHAAFSYAKLNNSHYNNRTLYYFDQTSNQNVLIHEEPQIKANMCDPNNLTIM
ncbi:hypothetical protein [Bacillus infantis]|jgi:hypothetical protein|uniref:hypothetical protein n=1 Tax=Bacillus infantis TaxID=324767 RepID=UPI002155CAB5|nr:hypothetical protein [Bacillus infantis]MCR6611394.1 hypothetical protein [Bacillus infantis]